MKKIKIRLCVLGTVLCMALGYYTYIAVCWQSIVQEYNESFDVQEFSEIEKLHSMSVGISILLIMGSLAIYQAYLGVTIALCFLYLLIMILDTGFSVSDIVRQTVKFFFAGTGALYYI